MARVTVPGRRYGSRGLWAALVAVTVLFALVRLVGSDSGQALLVGSGLTRHFLPQLADRLDVALAQRLVAMGLVRADIKVRDGTAGDRRLREYTFVCPQHLTPTLVHLEVQRAARAAHAAVLRAEELHERGDQLVLLLGFGRTPTHRLIVRAPPPAPRDVAGAPRRPRVALIVDDLGNNMNGTTRGFLDLGVPVTVAVLPDLRRSAAVLEAARSRGIPALLHLPMEPEGREDPGKDPVRVGMTPEEIDALVDRHVRRYAGLFGVNNHMGSRATADRPTMEALMKSLRRHDLLFVDSETTPRSVGRVTAREAGVWCIANDLFVDGANESAAQVETNLDRLAVLARKQGLAVGIAHPHEETLLALRAALPRLQAHGIELVTVESLRPGTNVAVRETGR